MADIYIDFLDEALPEDDWPPFLDVLQQITAEKMMGRPAYGTEYKEFNPNTDIPVISTAYDMAHSRPTAVFTIWLVSYDWPERTFTMPDRLSAILQAVTPTLANCTIPEGWSLAEIKFTTKPPGCWTFI
jgi:hypothetical protein